MCRYNYNDLENHFTLPVRMRVITGSFNDNNIKIPRKLKKKVKKYNGIHWKLLTNGQ